MNISYNWLSEYLDHQMSVTELTDLMTDIGLEVGKVHRYDSIPGGLEGVVIGKVISCVKHPDADRLRLTQVDIGLEDPVQIVCGAPNVDSGQTVAVATVGTTLYGNDNSSFKIKKSKIRGQLSMGMICAEDELHLGDSHDGIMVLPDELVAGSQASDYFDINRDHIIDVDLTPNRSDATSHYGSALDVAAAIRVRTKRDIHVQWSIPEINVVDKQPLTIHVEDTKRCPRYTGICIDGIEVKPSPSWLQDRLKSIGVRPINNIVDITNYILHGYGQPLHAFDRAEIKGNEIRVKTLPAGSLFKSLDEIDRKLYAEDLVICDGEDNPMCIGGVFGGWTSGVSDATTQIFLESAHFDARSNRMSATRHDLRTDAHKVFEKTHDIRRCVAALKTAVTMILELAGGQISSKIYDIYPEEKKSSIVSMRLDKLNSLSGHDFSSADVEHIFQSMDMKYVSLADGQSWDVHVPLDRADVTREVDLIEECMRMHGFNELGDQGKIAYSSDRNGDSGYYTTSENLVGICASLGFDQMMSMSLTKGEEIAWVKSPRENQVIINNTSNVKVDTMRPELLVSALENVRYNHARRQLDLQLFELGHKYALRAGEYQEIPVLGLLCTGNLSAAHWTGEKRPADAFYLKSIVSRILGAYGVQSEIKTIENEYTSQSIQWNSGGGAIAWMGPMAHELESQYDLQSPMCYAEIDIRELVAQSKQRSGLSEIAKYPSMTRDLAFEMPINQSYSDLELILTRSGGKLLKNVELISIYENDKLKQAGVQSWAVRMTFQHSDRTLTDQDVEPVIQRILKKSEKQLGVKLRG